MIFDIFKAKKEDEILEEMKMNCLALNEVLADKIDELNHTSVYDEQYETRLKTVSTLSGAIDTLENRIKEVENPRFKKEIDYVGILRALAEITKVLIICKASFDQVAMLANLEESGIIMSRNLNRLQLPRP